jgi:hypothetical protein
VGLWLALDRFNREGAFDFQKVRDAVSSLLDSGLTKMQLALSEGKEIWFYLSDPRLLFFAGIAFLAAFVTGLAIWRIAVMSWKAARMKMADLRRPRGNQKPKSES